MSDFTHRCSTVCFFIYLYLVAQFKTSNYMQNTTYTYIYKKALIFINFCFHHIEKTHKWAWVSHASSDVESRLRMRWNLYGFMTLVREDIPLQASWRSSYLWYIEVSRVCQNLKVALMNDEGGQWNTNDLQTFKFNLESIILYFMEISIQKWVAYFQEWRWHHSSDVKNPMRMKGWDDKIVMYLWRLPFFKEATEYYLLEEDSSGISWNIELTLKHTPYRVFEN
jgi:hypothetical protein